MAKEQVTGVVPGEGSLEWTVAGSTKGRIARQGGGRLDFQPAEEGAEAVEPSADQLKKLSVELKGGVSVALPSDKVLLRLMDFPDVEDDELEGMVELQMDKFSPFPVDSLVISHDVVHRSEGQCRVLAAAAQVDVIEEIVGKTVSAAGVQVDRVDVDILGWLRILRDEGRIKKSGRQILLFFTGKVPCIAVIDDGVPLVFRTLIERGDESEEDYRSELAGEVGHTLMTLEIEHGGAEAEAIDVFAEQAIPQSFIDELKDESGCDVKMQPLSSMPALSEGIARRIADPDDVDINLKPLSWRMAEEARVARRKIVNLSLVMFVVWGLMVGGFFGFKMYQDKRLAMLQEQKKKWEEPFDDVRGMMKRIRVIEQYMDRSDSALECLLEVTAAMPPDGLILTFFTYKKNTELKITGRADNRAMVLQFEKNLNKSQLFTDVSQSEMRIVKGKTQFNYTLKMAGEEE